MIELNVNFIVLFFRFLEDGFFERIMNELEGVDISIWINNVWIFKS